MGADISIFYVEPQEKSASREKSDGKKKQQKSLFPEGKNMGEIENFPDRKQLPVPQEFAQILVRKKLLQLGDNEVHPVRDFG